MQREGETFAITTEGLQPDDYKRSDIGPPMRAYELFRAACERVLSEHEAAYNDLAKAERAFVAFVASAEFERLAEEAKIKHKVVGFMFILV